jgi:predicted phage terminase large subunit-like protein
MISEDPLEDGDPRQIGESLWPWRFGTADDLEATKISAGTYTWSSLYQQRPSPAGGSIFNRGWWGDSMAVAPNRNQFYNQSPKELETLMDIVIQSWDATFKDTSGTDFVVGQVWGRKGADYYLLDQVRDRMDIIATMQSIRMLSSKWPLSSAKLIEDKANGPAIISMLRREIAGIIPVEPQGGKVVRAQAIVPYVESGNVWLPQPRNAPWLNDVIEELSTFPTGKQDDIVDSMSQALTYLSKKNTFTLPKIPKKTIRISGGWNG